MTIIALLPRLSLCVSQIRKPVSVISSGTFQERFYAKRVRVKPQKKKLKEEKVDKSKKWEPRKLDKYVVQLTRKELEASYQPPPVDNVWLIKNHRPSLYNIGEILKMHRETHHPTIFNEPDGLIYATLDLNMSLGETKTKPLDAFRSVISYPNYFKPDAERRILGLCKDAESQQEALKAGAVLSGGAEIIQMFKSNEVTAADFDHIVVHPDILLDVVSIRGMIKHHFPTKQRGNLGPNMGELVHKFVKGVDYKSNKDLFEEKYASVDVTFARLSMEQKAIKENLAALLLEINERRLQALDTPFITSVNIWSPPSNEKLFVDFWQYLEGYDADAFISKYTTVNYMNM